MLNRRSLRIKVMQSLFAFQQNKEANYLLCHDRIDQIFSPDLNSMEVQDKKILSKQKAYAQKIFDKAFEEGETSVVVDDKEIEKTVNDSFVFYAKAVKKDAEFFREDLVLDVEKIYDSYIAVLSLAIAFAETAEADKKINHSNFLKNPWIKALRENSDLKKESLRLSRTWVKKSDRVREWFKDVVKQDNDYMSYLDKKSPSPEDKKRMINHFFRKIILGKTVINDHFEEEILRWAEDHEIIKGMVEKTVKSFNPAENKPITLHQLSLNWEDDRDFIEILFNRAANLEVHFKELIAKNTRNWEVDRLPLTDRVILEMAIAELVSFQNIPVKVTINEYIELAKNYSTPKSRQFINGILDVLYKELKARGEIKKSGRGLIDNK